MPFTYRDRQTQKIGVTPCRAAAGRGRKISGGVRGAARGSDEGQMSLRLGRWWGRGRSVAAGIWRTKFRPRSPGSSVAPLSAASGTVALPKIPAPADVFLSAKKHPPRKPALPPPSRNQDLVWLTQPRSRHQR